MSTSDSIPPPDSTAVDVEAFREQMREAGVEAVVPQILGTFASDLSNQESQLRAALESRDPDTIASRAHGLKSASGSIHAYRLQAILAAIESRAKDSDLDGCGSLAEEAYGEIDRVRAQLDAMG